MATITTAPATTPWSENRPRPEMGEDVFIHKIPSVDEIFKSKYFTIQITEKNGDQYKAEIISSVREERHPIGEILEIDEVAFQSDYYSSTM